MLICYLPFPCVFESNHVNLLRFQAVHLIGFVLRKAGLWALCLILLMGVTALSCWKVTEIKLIFARFLSLQAVASAHSGHKHTSTSQCWSCPAVGGQETWSGWMTVTGTRCVYQPVTAAAGATEAWQDEKKKMWLYVCAVTHFSQIHQKHREDLVSPWRHCAPLLPFLFLASQREQVWSPEENSGHSGQRQKQQLMWSCSNSSRKKKCQLNTQPVVVMVRVASEPPKKPHCIWALVILQMEELSQKAWSSNQLI